MSPRLVNWRYLPSVLVGLTVVLAAGCGDDAGDAAPGSVAAVPLPQPDVEGMEPQVRRALDEAGAAIVTEPSSAAAWGHYGMVLHAHEMWSEAATAYRRAIELDPTTPKWSYFLGDVLSVLGGELTPAVDALNRFVGANPDYAPGHLRLGRVLLAAGRGEEAATALELAIELEPTLIPARVSLGQLRLDEGRLTEAEALLEAVLAEAPRHEQALAALSQVYMRQGRRDDARAMAARTDSAASYNLYDDPVMSEVVAQGVSSVLIRERAKAFLDNGNDRQAAIGLRRVVELRPDDAGAHQLLAVAVGNLGDLEGAERHLERATELEPDSVPMLVQLAAVQLERGRPGAAAMRLEQATGLAPDDPEVPWLLGRAQLATDRPAEALATFERATGRGFEAPGWALNEWGSALARLGRPEAALRRFEQALALDPEDRQALFYSGLTHEGSGRVERAVAMYCRALEIGEAAPATARLQALGRGCD